MKPFQFDNDFFLGHHCPPIKMTERELNRLREAVNWQIGKWIEMAPVVLDVDDKNDCSICDMEFIEYLRKNYPNCNRSFGRVIAIERIK